MASQAGVRISGVRYQLKDAPIDGLQQVEITSNLSGGYLQLVRFINAMERNKLFFLIEGVELGGEQNGVVGLQLRIQTYMRST